MSFKHKETPSSGDSPERPARPATEQKKSPKGGVGSGLTAALRDLFFPPRCVGCGDLLPPFKGDGEIFCPLCRVAWETARVQVARDAASDRGRGLVYLLPYRSGQGEGVPERLIYHLKQRGDPRVLAYVAERLTPALLEVVDTLPACSSLNKGAPLLFTYPPRRPSALRREGFDQAKRLARAMAKACGGELAGGGTPPLISRTRRGKREQKTLNATERETNAQAAYTLTPSAASRLRDRTVVICDDLYTTGATLQRCASLVVEAGAARVILCTVARTRSS